MSSEPNRVGSVIASKYRLDEELGRGGMGAVYRVFHLKVHKVFALKVLLGEMAKHRSIASRFLLEAQAAGRIGHPGILDVYDVGEEADGTPYIVMELLRGEALSTLVRRERLDVDAACWIAMEVLDILEAAHKAGIIHRDVKPQNVFVTEKSGTESASSRGVKLLDFGIAKFSGVAADGSALTRSGEIIGSPLYMAPEQAKGEPDLDPRADVWSVGAMLFEMLTGACAHAATTPVAVLAKILTEQAPAPSSKDPRIPEKLDAVVAKALRIDRAERWPTAAVMRDALAEVRASLGTAGKAPSLPKPEKVSLPPASTDRTPGAITSTVIASDPPPSPSRSPSGPASRVPSHAPEAIAATERAQVTTAKSGGARSPLLYVAIGAAAVGAIAVGAGALRSPSAPPPSASDRATNDALLEPPHPAAPSAAPSAAAVSPNLPVGEAPSAAAVSLNLPVGEAPSAARSAAVVPLNLPVGEVASARPAVSVWSLPVGEVASSAPVASAPARRASAPAAAAPAPTARCAAGETLSNGHCCARGLEWQNGRCERPLATTF